jgi:TraM recognition site of TraD and TraG
LLVVLVAAVGGAGAAFLAHRRTGLSARNWYLLAAVSAGAVAAAVVLRAAAVLLAVLGAAFVAAAVASICGRRWRLTALGAAGELREYELARRMLWRRRSEDEARTHIATQGELVVRRQWPDLPALPLGRRLDEGRVPRGEGRHLLILGGTGSGKTVSADRIAVGRAAVDRIPLFVLDPKGDRRLREDLEALAGHLGWPFIVFDPFDPASDRWDPLWSGEPGRTVARALSPIQTSEPYYADTLRIHLGVVAEALELLGLWPASMPLLLEAAQAASFAALRDLVLRHGAPPELLRRVDEQAALVDSRSGERDIASGAARLRVVAGTSWRGVLTPREDGRAVQLPAAMRGGAIVLWRTWVEDTPEEAEAITTLALADLIAAAAEVAGEAEWLVVLDEFGSVLAGNAARRALGILGRARSAGGQAIVVTQSAADVPTATGNEAMLESLADNFSGYVVHRQTSAQSREWVAKLFGTREMWQSTDQTRGGGGYAEGTGSRRRAREFIVRPDALKELRVGQAYVWSPAGPPPERIDVAVPPTLPGGPAASGDPVYRHAGPLSLGECKPPDRRRARGPAKPPAKHRRERREGAPERGREGGRGAVQPPRLRRREDDRL